jgi:hypothetical protein
MGFKYIRKFYSSKLPIFNKYATDVSDTVMDQYEIERRAENIRNAREYWQICPIKLYDKRFDWKSVLPKDKTDKTAPICPVTFVKDKNKPWKPKG